MKIMGFNALAGLGIALSGFVGHAVAGPDFSQVEYRQVSVVDGLVMLQGAGGNVGVVSDTRGALVIDNDYAALSTKLLAAIEKEAPEGVRYVVNTHWHADHAGGNRAMGESKATIVAHRNARERLRTGGTIELFGMKTGPGETIELPVITYEREVDIHWGGKTVRLEYAADAHTDGDSVVYFHQQGELVAVQTGDVFFNGFYPFIDPENGGNAEGMVAAVATILANITDDTPIIPGHGPLANKADLQAYHDFMAEAVRRIKSLKQAGESREKVIAARPIKDFEAQWGDGFLQTDVWVGIVFDSL